MNRNGKKYDDMTREELEQELREAFLDTDIIDDHLNNEMEKMRETLNQKWPIDYPYTPEESWERFLSDNAEELEPFLHPKSAAETNTQLSEDDWFDPEKSWQRFLESRGAELAEILGPQLTDQEKTEARTHHVRSVPSLLRIGIIAAVIVVLLAGAALASGPQLWSWVRGWSDVPERYAPTGSGAAGPILEALEDLGITEPVYPSWLPQDYELAEAHISQDPLLLYELYTRWDRFITITITPISTFDAVLHPKEYQLGETGHYLFSNGGTVTAVWYTENYYTAISSNITARAMQRIVDSISGKQKGRNPE